MTLIEATRQVYHNPLRDPDIYIRRPGWTAGYHIWTSNVNLSFNRFKHFDGDHKELPGVPELTPDDVLAEDWETFKFSDDDEDED